VRFPPLTILRPSRFNTAKTVINPAASSQPRSGRVKARSGNPPHARLLQRIQGASVDRCGGYHHGLANHHSSGIRHIALSVGGNPVGFAGCTAGRLTIKELTQCFSGGSCFGPNNTIVKAYSNAFKDLLHGPGANNEIVVAFNSLKMRLVDRIR
jgi:hypothetical protein